MMVIWKSEGNYRGWNEVSCRKDIEGIYRGWNEVSCRKDIEGIDLYQPRSDVKVSKNSKKKVKY